MGTIMMSGAEYLLYLRYHQDQLERFILECFQKAKGQSLREQEIFAMVEKEFRCNLPVNDSENVILKGVLTNLLDRYEIQGILLPVSMEEETGYQLVSERAA